MEILSMLELWVQSSNPTILKLGNVSPLIINGVSLGGSVASLFTLWLLKDNNKRPTCFTFGSPLLGDSGLQQAISERPSWNSSFLYIVPNQDPIPRSLISLANDFAGSIPQSCIYNPFSMFLLCSDSVIFKEISQLCDFREDQLQAGIDLQLEAIRIGGQKRVEESFSKKSNTFDPGKKLNKMKEAMAWLEWYMKVTLNEGGYVDSYKRSDFRGWDAVKSTQEIAKYQRVLNKYWKAKVAEVEEMPQSEKAAFRTRWLYSGTNYRRMVEPLNIAEYYMKSGNIDYVNLGRSEHYKKLEEWRKEDNPSGSGNDRKKSISLTDDSCFWAYVEETIIHSKRLREGSLEEKENARECLVNFEEYVMNMIRSYSVSSENFHPHSSVMKWWKDYRQDILSCLSNLPLAYYMENEEYQSYA
ncbi:hypothetical protein R3W88_005040 [Solanum pinnatisectum]|uniref:Senescence-associated carboxylesterase 101-like n=1 Tax=Solanum pinnatisectum TaxID=50273 RepID=A0AAV9KB08_9SOLN|nr:hypothetical protein R3W88_005040 [Solanum pinnatisectum]